MGLYIVPIALILSHTVDVCILEVRRVSCHQAR
jgi:hypothetical protein